ncbi:MAG: CoB--CoM heterodisulfide reductase iron-sulfur subunit A family protein [Promethearchaeota archaeon]|nr:MAG: CoB--CoM heterodisulfide reductase iron-sulfur subunit A family protein [Candidatus Lokiarchaeota archaeon]
MTEIQERKVTAKEPPKIGVYVCHCGINIAGVVDVFKLKDYALTLPDVALAREYKFMCSDNGQNMIKDDIEAGLINRVVVAACSPRMHEPTFRLACKEAGLNQFLFEQANIREHAAWVNMEDHEGAYEIARDHLRMAIAKVRKLVPLQVQEVSVEPSCLIIGAGIAGMNAALDLADEGYKVYLVEKDPTIGGHMAQLDKTFPTMDCSACILTPRMVDVARKKNIEIMTYSEVTDVSGYVGNFEVTIMKKPHYVDQEKCTACGACVEKCPVTCGNEFDLGMATRKAIYIPFPQAVPGQYTIDMDKCIKCGICARKDVCEPEAINYDDKAEYVKAKIGTIIIATGWDLYDPTELEQYGYGRYPNVITGLQMERLLSSFGPVLGKPVRPSDGKPPHSIAFLQCVGSRNFREGGHTYCSRVCCMYATKQARQYKEKHPEAEVYIFYIDIRAFGKGYEEFYESAAENYGIKYIRGRIAEVYEGEDNKIVIRSEDTLLQEPIELAVDMFVLSCGLEARADADKLASLLSVQRSADGFFMEAHPKLKPVDTLTDGIFVAGVAQGPKDIPDTVAQAKGAASSAAALMAQGEVEIEPYYAVVIEHLCSGCRSCQSLCPFGAIDFDEFKKVAVVNPALCKGCGTCVAACPSQALIQNHFANFQLNSIINVAVKPTTIENGGK